MTIINLSCKQRQLILLYIYNAIYIYIYSDSDSDVMSRDLVLLKHDDEGII